MSEMRSADIFIIGLGTVVGWQLTREAEHALRKSEKVFYLDSGLGSADFLRSICKETIDLNPLSYQEGQPRRAAYDRMSALVLKAALETRPVAFAVYGHPRVYVYPTEQISSAAKLLNLKVRIIPGISSLDTMFVDLDLDPGLNGFQMYEATDLIARDRPLQIDVPAMIWQVGVVGTGLYTDRQSNPERFQPLLKHLLKFYGSDHVVSVVKSADTPLTKSSLKNFRLEDLPNLLAGLISVLQSLHSDF